jgi:hypothetical protein
MKRVRLQKKISTIPTSALEPVKAEKGISLTSQLHLPS